MRGIDEWPLTAIKYPVTVGLAILVEMTGTNLPAYR